MRAEHGTRGEFALALCRLRESEIDDVGAGDEEQEAGRTEQEDERRASVAGDGIAQRLHGDGDHGGVVAELLFEARGNRGKFAARSGEWETVAQPGDHLPVVRAAAGESRRYLARHPDIGVVRITKVGRQDSDDGNELRIHFQANRGEIARGIERLAPEGVAYKSNRRGAKFLFFWGK